MSKKELLRIIESIGLQGVDAQLYLAGLALQSGAASVYARKTNLNRITAYNHLENLVKEGIFTDVEESGGKRYSPISPDHLALEARKNVETLYRSLPELRSLQGPQHRAPQVRMYHGSDGIRRVYEDTLTAQGEILNFANSALVREFWGGYDDAYVSERVRRGIQLRGIAPDDEVGRAVQGEDKKCLRKIRLVTGKEYNFNNEINIYDSKLAIASFGETEADHLGVIIESPEIAETQRQIFEMVWQFAGAKKKNRM